MNKDISKQKLDDVVHEVSQPLTVAVNYIEGCIRYLKRETISQDIIEALEEAVSEIEQSGKLIREHRDNCLKGCDKEK